MPTVNEWLAAAGLPGLVGLYTPLAVDDVEEAEDENMSSWWLVLCPADGGQPTVDLITSEEELVNVLAGLDGGDLFAFVFAGDRLEFSQGPNRALRLVDGRRRPFNPKVSTSELFVPQKDGYLGDFCYTADDEEEN